MKNINMGYITVIASCGRNFDGINRSILSLQKADKDSVTTPANWRPGDDTIIPTLGSCGVAKKRMENQIKL